MNLENTPLPTKDNISGLILAGGRGTRFNDADKGLIAYKDSTLVEHAIARLQPQVSNIIVSANRNFEFYQGLNIPFIKDRITGYSGPLAGIHAALENMDTPWLVSIACDTPCFPLNYVEQLMQSVKKDNSLIAVASSHNRLQNISMLLHQSLYLSLDTFLKAGERKAQIWLEQHNPAIVEFNHPAHAFYNINSPDELSEIERLSCNE